MQNNTFLEKAFLFKYPWLPGGREIFEPVDAEIEDSALESGQTDPVEYLKSVLGDYFDKYPDLQLRITKIFVFALEKREKGILLKEEGKFNIVLYYMIKTILAAFNNKTLDNHLANFISTLYYQKILDENERHIYQLANYMGLLCSFIGHAPKKFNGVKYSYWVEYQSYITAAGLLKDDYWNLINRYMINGKVYLIKEHLVRLLKEKIRLEIIPERIGPMDELLENLRNVSALSEIIISIENKIELLKIQKRKLMNKLDDGSLAKYNFSDDEKPSYNLYPPCIKNILDKALDGVNLVHNERLHIAFFFANTNHDVEETVDVFRTLPDFDEKIARYNVEFSRGIKGKGKKYKVFNCDKLKSLQICMADDKKYGDQICYRGVKKKGESSYHPIKSPLSYIFWKKVYLNRQKQQEYGKNVPKTFKEKEK
ncbi:MAG: hypothetical protein ACTSWY_08960 [Promethearchaeota archaeon]